jgi:hypothetical protein
MRILNRNSLIDKETMNCNFFKRRIVKRRGRKRRSRNGMWSEINIKGYGNLGMILKMKR